MTASGVKPKINGDVLHHQDVNMSDSSFAPFTSALYGKNRTNKLIYDNLTSDSADTKTNLTYSSSYTDEYYAAGNIAITFESMGYKIPANVDELSVCLDYNIYTVIDECDDNAVNAAIWTNITGGGQVTEDADRLSCTDSGAAAGALASTLDISGYGAVQMYFRLRSAASDVRKSDAWLKLIDSGVNTSTILTANGIAIAVGYRSWQEIYGIATFYINWTDKKVLINLDYYNDRHTNLAGAPGVGENPDTWKEIKNETQYVDVTGWADLSIKLETLATGVGAGDSAVAECFYLRKLLPSPTSALTLSASANGGTNYQTIQNNTRTLFSNAGSEIMVKISGTVVATEVLSIKGVRLGL